MWATWLDNSEGWHGIAQDDFRTNDKNAAKEIARQMHKYFSECTKAEVREYTSPPSVPKKAVEAVEQEIQKMNTEGVRRSAKAQAVRILTAALPHLQKGAK